MKTGLFRQIKNPNDQEPERGYTTSGSAMGPGDVWEDVGGKIPEQELLQKTRIKKMLKVEMMAHPGPGPGVRAPGSLAIALARSVRAGARPPRPAGDRFMGCSFKRGLQPSC